MRAYANRKYEDDNASCQMRSGGLVVDEEPHPIEQDEERRLAKNEDNYWRVV